MAIPYINRNEARRRNLKKERKADRRSRKRRRDSLIVTYLSKFRWQKPMQALFYEDHYDGVYS